MSWDFYDTTTQKARKDYRCDASDWLVSVGLNELDLTDEEKLVVEKAQSENWKILKGTEYIKIKGKWDGEFSEFRARPELNQICLAHEVYQE